MGLLYPREEKIATDIDLGRKICYHMVKTSEGAIKYEEICSAGICPLDRS